MSRDPGALLKTCGPRHGMGGAAHVDTHISRTWARPGSDIAHPKTYCEECLKGFADEESYCLCISKTNFEKYMKLQRFWIKEHRHPETIPATKCNLYRSTRRMAFGFTFRQSLYSHPSTPPSLRPFNVRSRSVSSSSINLRCRIYSCKHLRLLNPGGRLL